MECFIMQLCSALHFITLNFWRLANIPVRPMFYNVQPRKVRLNRCTFRRRKHNDHVKMSEDCMMRNTLMVNKIRSMKLLSQS